MKPSTPSSPKWPEKELEQAVPVPHPFVTFVLQRAKRPLPPPEVKGADKNFLGFASGGGCMEQKKTKMVHSNRFAGLLLRF
jgi:hypothetical protein